MNILLKYFPSLTSEQINQYNTLENLYREWNSKINVISRKDIDSLYEKHILHSLSIAVLFDFKAGTDILDIGTGGGFPGIPLAIFFPGVNFHLIDSINKKLKVVKAIAESTGLKNISTTHIRAEEIKNGKYDFVITRAVASLKELWNWSKPLLKPVPVNSNKLFFKVEKKSMQLRKDSTVINVGIPGLIALKGGNLKNEIQESGLTPQIIEIGKIFSEEFFKEKYMIYVPNKKQS